MVTWLRGNESELVTSPIVLGELEYGICRLPAGPKRRRLQLWFAQVAQRLPVLVFDADTASTWAGLLARLRKKGLAMPVKDSLIAATALVHNLALVTRNTADYRHAGLMLVKPFDD